MLTNIHHETAISKCINQAASNLAEAREHSQDGIVHFQHFNQHAQRNQTTFEYKKYFILLKHSESSEKRQRALTYECNEHSVSPVVCIIRGIPTDLLRRGKQLQNTLFTCDMRYAILAQLLPPKMLPTESIVFSVSASPYPA